MALVYKYKSCLKKENMDLLKPVGYGEAAHVSESNIEEYLKTEKATDTFWGKLLSTQKFGETFIRKHLQEMPFAIVIKTQGHYLSEEFFLEFGEQITKVENSAMLCSLPIAYLRKYADKLDWEQIVKYRKLDESAIREFFPRLNLQLLPYTRLSPEFYEELGNKLPSHFVYRNFCMPEGYEEEFKDYLQTCFYDEEG